MIRRTTSEALYFLLPEDFSAPKQLEVEGFMNIRRRFEAFLSLFQYCLLALLAPKVPCIFFPKYVSEWEWQDFAIYIYFFLNRVDRVDPKE